MKRVLTGLIRFYQAAISPLFPRTCRFYPSCSEYARQAVTHFGWWKGGKMALARLARCHPFHPGGYDPVISAEEPQAATKAGGVTGAEPVGNH